MKKKAEDEENELRTLSLVNCWLVGSSIYDALEFYARFLP